MAALSGPVAEQSFVGYPRDARAMMWGSSWKADRAKAEGHLRRSSMARTLGDAALKAAQLVTEYWPAIGLPPTLNPHWRVLRVGRTAD